MHLQLERLEPRNLLDRGSIAMAFAASPEFLARAVGGFYTVYLDRQGSTAEIQLYVAGVQHGMSEEAVEACFVASEEYREQFPDDAAWLTQVYQDYLFRRPDAAGLEHWLGEVERIGHEGVAGAVIGSVEGRGQYAVRTYERFLYRRPGGAGLGDPLGDDPRELADAMAVLVAADRAALRARVLASDEYFAGVFAGKFHGSSANASEERWVVWLYLDVLGRGTLPTEADVDGHLFTE